MHTPTSPDPERVQRDGLAAAALGAACALLFVSTAQRALWGDGTFFGGYLLREGHLAHPRALFLAAAGLLRPVAVLWRPGEPWWEASQKLVSALSGGLCVALVFLAARTIGAPRLRAALAAAVLALTPGFWFQATATEVHALHAACVALFVWAAARALSGEKGARVALGLAAGAALAVLAHLSGWAIVWPAALIVAYVGRRFLSPLALGLGAAALVLVLLDRASAEVESYVGLYRTYFRRRFLVPAFYGHALLVAARDLLLWCAPVTWLGLLAWIGGRRDRTARWLGWTAAAGFAAASAPATSEIASFFVPWLPPLAVLAARRVGARGLATAALLALAASVVFTVPRLDDDPVRERIRRVAAVLGPDADLVVIGENSERVFQWRLFYPHEPDRPVFVLDPLAHRFLPPERALDAARADAAAVRRRLREGRRVFVVAAEGALPGRYAALLEQPALRSLLAGLSAQPVPGLEGVAYRVVTGGAEGPGGE